MLKSALMLSKSKLMLILILEDKLLLSLKEKVQTVAERVKKSSQLEEWRKITDYAFNFRVLPLTFPKINSQEWKKLFKPCASQRLFLLVRIILASLQHSDISNCFSVFCFYFQSVLVETDSVLYVDTDTLFLSPIEEVWDHFDAMNATQMAALVQDIIISFEEVSFVLYSECLCCNRLSLCVCTLCCPVVSIGW